MTDAMGGTYAGTPWWAEKDPSHELWRLVRDQYQRQAGRYRTIRRYQNIYEFSYKAADRVRGPDREYDEVVLSFNRAQNAVDTIIAEVTSAKIAPMAVTDGATWDERDNAEKATHGLASVVRETDFDGKMEDIWIDVCTASMGFLSIAADTVDGCILADRINPLDILADEAESYYGKPRCLYRRWVVDKYWAAERFGQPSKEYEGSAVARREKILSAAAPSLLPEEMWTQENDHSIEIIEAWHLPAFAEYEETEEEEATDDVEGTKPRRRRVKKTDGRHVLAVDGMMLLDEPYTKKDFPILIVRPKKSRRGFWGIPVMRQLAPGQRECELMDMKLQKTHKRMGGAHILVHRDAKMLKRTITNDSGDILEWEGQVPPTEWTPAPASPQTYSYRETVSSDMLRYIGVSQFSARSELPSGMEQSSGRAIKMMVDQGSKYLGPWLRERERAFKRAMDLMLDAVEELVEADPEYTTRYVHGQGFEKVNWSEIVEQRDNFVIDVEPINALSTSPGARADQVTDWLKAGAIDPPRWRKLSGVLDLQAENALDFSDRELVEKLLTKMVKEQIPMTPEPFEDFALILEIGRKFNNMCRVQGVSDERLRVVRDYLVDAKFELDKQKAQQAPPPPMPGGPPPMGGGEPMPAGAPPEMPPMPQEMPQAA